MRSISYLFRFAPSVGRLRRLRVLSPISFIAVLLAVVPPVRAQLIPSFGSDRAGTSGYQFLKIPVDPRSAAMGETVAANAMDASALFWNPALAAQTGITQIGFAHTAYYVDVTIDYAAAIFHLRRLGLTLGASVQALNSGEMDVTTEFQPFGTGEQFRFTDVAAGLTVAQQLTDLFSYGVTTKYIQESVAGVTSNTVVFDLGIFYRIGTTGAQMAVAIRNFGFDGTPSGSLERTVIGQDARRIEEDFSSLTPPTTFLLGITYDVLRGDRQNDLQISGQLNNPNDNAESFNLGVEYTWHDLLILRGGYRFGVEEYTLPSLGAGLNLGDILGNVSARFDYGFTRLDRLGTVHRVGVNLEL
ncbi:MAG: PorV/PorQ family protein [Rhodothermales bacterium]